MAKLLHISSLTKADEEALAALGLEADREIFKRGKKIDTVIASSCSPISPNAENHIIIASSEAEERKEGREAYYMLPPSVKLLPKGEGELVPSSVSSQIAKFSSSFSPLVSFTSEEKDFVPLLCYESGEVAAFRFNSLIVIPNIGNKDEIEGIIRAAIKDKTACRSVRVEAGSKAEKLLLKKADAEERWIRAKAQIEKEISEAAFLPGLSSSSLEEFSAASVNFFKFLGFEVKEELSRGYILSLNDDLFLFYPELSATKEISALPATRLRSKLRKQEGRSGLKLIIACASQMFLPAESRSDMAINVPEDAAAVSAPSMISFYENVKRGVLKKEDALAELLEGGLVTFLPEDDDAITRIDKVSKTNELLSRATLEGRAIKKGMKVTVKDRQGRLRSARIMNVKVGSVYLTEAVEGVVTIETDSPLSPGDYLFSAR